MSEILDRLTAGEILVGDGAMGSLLIQRGLKQGQCPELLNQSNPKILEDIARLYFEAGAQIVETNTFGGSPAKLHAYGVDEQCEILNRSAVECVRNVVGGRAYIAGSCGPTGQMLKPYGTAEPQDIRTGFKRQIGTMAEGGADLICIETMTDINEATLAIEAAKAVAPDLPIIATMTFDKTPRGYFTIMGVSIKEAVEKLVEAGADILGSNCGNGLENMIEIARDFKKLTDMPLLIQANAGKPELRDGIVFYPESPAFFAEKVPELIDTGVSIIGGCCGTDPEYIKTIKSTVNRYLHK
ncbi:homocysteine S-methyltransferase family protein [bacterium]|nr:homocysteine S-methyltransferase family protein [bacterium]